MDYGVKEPLENIVFAILWFAFLIGGPVLLILKWA